jgi:hypothetical protein
MLSTTASVFLAPLTQRMGVCELCSVGPEALRAAVVVRHTRGGVVQLAACDRCAAGVRRLIAVAGGASAGGPANIQVESESPVTVASTDVSLADTVGEPVLAHEYADPFRDDAGQLYVVRVYGQERADGTWIGWLTFVTPDGQTIRRTSRETTQSNREHLNYWAAGLQPSYIDGAFHRAR